MLSYYVHAAKALSHDSQMPQSMDDGIVDKHTVKCQILIKENIIVGSSWVPEDASRVRALSRVAKLISFVLAMTFVVYA